MNVKSINFRLTLWYTFLVVVIALGFGAYTYSSVKHRLYEQWHNILEQRIERLRDNAFPNAVGSTPEKLSQRIREHYSPEENDRFIRISKSDGTVLYVSGVPNNKSFDPAHIPLFRDYSTQITEPMESLRATQQLILMGYIAPVAGNNYIFEMGLPTSPIHVALNKLLVTLFIGLPFIIVIAVVGGSILVRRALGPVESIRATAEKITFSNLRQRLPVQPSGDAIEHLAQTLNQMLARLEFAFQQASQFSADASHELRTPLSVMRAELESLVSEMRRANAPTNIQGRINSVLEETERLSSIVESLFAIVRLDAGEAKIENEVFDLVVLVQTTVEHMQLLAEEKNHTLSVDGRHPVFIAGDSPRIKQVVVNLLDNAIKYTLPGGIIRLSVCAKADKAIFTVKDNGIGIAPEEIPHVFKRFYRADKVRTRSDEGAGLGLSIVRAICYAHGGTVDASSKEGVGTTVTVELPLVIPHTV